MHAMHDTQTVQIIDWVINIEAFCSLLRKVWGCTQHKADMSEQGLCATCLYMLSQL